MSGRGVALVSLGWRALVLASLIRSGRMPLNYCRPNSAVALMSDLESDSVSWLPLFPVNGSGSKRHRSMPGTLTRFIPPIGTWEVDSSSGAISQAVVGAGLSEAAVRGAIIGAMAGGIMLWVRTPTTAWWRVPLHLSLLTGVFAGIRETTFVQWGDLVQTWLLTLAVIAFVGALVASVHRGLSPAPRRSRQSPRTRGRPVVIRRAAFPTVSGRTP